MEQDIHYSIDKITSHLRLRILLIQLLSIQTFDLYRTKLYQYYPSELLDNWENWTTKNPKKFDRLIDELSKLEAIF